MPLTGKETLWLAIFLAGAMPGVALYSWNRVGRGSTTVAKWSRWTWRGTVMFGSQLTAVILVAVLINDAGKFYPSWLELLGGRHTLHHTIATPGLQDQAIRADLIRLGRRGTASA